MKNQTKITCECFGQLPKAECKSSVPVCALGGAWEEPRYRQQQWPHSRSLPFFWAYEKQEKNTEEDDTTFTKVKRPVDATILAPCSRFDQERDLKWEIVAHPKKREQRPLLNFCHISSSGTKGAITDTLSTREGGGSIEEKDTHRKGKPNRAARINSNKILPCGFSRPWSIKAWG